MFYIRNIDGKGTKILCLLAVAGTIGFNVGIGSAFADPGKLEPTRPPHRQIPDTNYEAYLPYDVSGPYQCPWSTHWQAGDCVTVTTPKVRYTDDFGAYKRFFCPPTHPYPFEGAFSGNPEWTDNSLQVRARVEPVDVRGRKGDPNAYSYAGVDAVDPGFVTVAEIFENPDKRNEMHTAGVYLCTHSYANPL